MFNYDGLNNILKNRHIGKTILSKELGLSTRTIAKIKKGEKLSKASLQKIADYLGVSISSLYKEISDNKLLQILRDEKEAHISGGFYHELQVRMTYNSNHIEGSKLAEEQTRLIFETNTIGENYTGSVDDILETVHHFKAIDYVIDIAEETLTEEIIKKLHYLLKHDTKDADISWFAIGDYKKRANVVGGKETTKPENVSKEIQELLKTYNNLDIVNIEDIVGFHARFEQIHPFQDGNGRVGRLIALKECLKNNIVPFIIEDEKKYYYYRGISNWNNEKGWLNDTCLDGQDSVKNILDMLGIKY